MKHLGLAIVLAVFGVLLIGVAEVGTKVSDDARKVMYQGGPGLGPYDFSQRNTNYMCTDGRGFGLQFQGSEERWAVIKDGTNGLLFNLWERSLGARQLYGDGTILVSLQGTLANVTVGGEVYFADCELRTWEYACTGDKSFILDVLPFDKSEAIFTDGTNRKRFTIYRQNADQLTRYDDGTLRVDLNGDSAIVFVEGQTYFTGCSRQY